MVRASLAVVLLYFAACDDASPSMNRPVDAGTNMDASVDARAAVPTKAVLTASSAQLAKRIGTTVPARGNVFIQVAVSLNNTGEDVPLSAPPSAFALEAAALLLYPGRTAAVDAAGSCAPAVEIERGGTLACEMAFELPKRTTVERLLYADDTGRSASGAIGVVQPAPSLCTLLHGSQCGSCLSSRMSICDNGPPGTRAAAACASQPGCVSIGGCPSVATSCTLSAACQDAVDDLEACYYDGCFGFFCSGDQ